MRPKRLSFSVLALVLAGLLVAAQRIAANSLPLLDLLNGRTDPAPESQPLPVPTAVIAPATATAALPTAAAAPLPTAVITQTAVPTPGEVYNGLDAVVALLQDLQAKRNAVYMQPGSGWWHSVTRTEGRNTGATFADGSPVPTAYTTEDWSFVDERGYITRIVSIQDTGSPATSQIGVFQNGTWRDLSTGEVDKQEPVFAPGISRVGELREFQQEVSNGYIQAVRDVWNGMDVYVVSWYTPFPDRAKMLGVPENAVGTLGKTYYSAQDGHELANEFYYQLDDGSTLLLARTVTEVLEPVESPPADVMAYLK